MGHVPTKIISPSILMEEITVGWERRDLLCRRQTSWKGNFLVGPRGLYYGTETPYRWIGRWIVFQLT